MFLACHKSLACQQITLTTNCEMVACKIHLKANNKSLIVLSVYRSPNRDLNDMCGVICELVNKRSNSTVWIGGDLNLPDLVVQLPLITTQLALASMS